MRKFGIFAEKKRKTAKNFVCIKKHLTILTLECIIVLSIKSKAFSGDQTFVYGSVKRAVGWCKTDATTKEITPRQLRAETEKGVERDGKRPLQRKNPIGGFMRRRMRICRKAGWYRDRFSSVQRFLRGIFLFYESKRRTCMKLLKSLVKKITKKVFLTVFLTSLVTNAVLALVTFKFVSSKVKALKANLLGK